MLRKSLSAICLVAVLLLRTGDSTPTGAPTTACRNMTPQHNGTLAQGNPSPYTATVTAAGGANMFNFRVTAAATRPFKGLFVQARDVNNQIVGTFTANADLQVIDCLTGTMNAATHVMNDTKTDVSVLWTGATGLALPVNMYYTTCENFDTFWVMESVPIPLA